MKIKEFLKYFNFSKLESTHSLLIPVKNESFKNPLEFDICIDKRKVILDDYEYGFTEDYDFFVSRYGIKAKKQNDKDYDLIDYNDLGNNFYLIHDKNDNAWIFYEVENNVE